MGETIGSILSFGTGALDTLYDIRKTNYMVHAQEEQAGAQMDWQSKEAEKAREYNTGERIASQNWQQQMMQQQNEYNSPAEQVKRFQSAGLNPALAMGGSGLQSVSAPSGSSSPQSSPMPAQVQGISPVPSYSHGTSIVQSLKDFADARKAMAETKTEDLMRDPQFQDLMTSIYGKELANKNMELLVTFERLALPKKIQKLGAEIANLSANVMLADSEKAKNDSLIKLNNAYTKVQEELAGLTNTQGLIAKNELSSWWTAFNNEQKESKSRVSRNYAEARNQRAQAAVNEWEAHWRKSTEGWRSDEFYESLVKLRNENAISAELLQQAKSATAQAKYAEDNKEIVFWKDLILGAVSAGTDIFSAYTRLKGVKAWQQMSDNQKASIEHKIEQMRWEYGDKVEVTTPTSTGGKKVRTYRRPYSKNAGTKD